MQSAATKALLLALSWAALVSTGVESYSSGPQSRPAQQGARDVPPFGIGESSPRAPSRRIFLEHALASGAAAALAPAHASAAMETEDFSNEFIQKLKAQSDAKKSEYDAQASTGASGWQKMNTAKFSAQYERPTYVGVRRKDMTYKMLSAEEVEELKKTGVIIAE